MGTKHRKSKKYLVIGMKAASKVIKPQLNQNRITFIFVTALKAKEGLSC
jgi:hypothetical protein